MLTDADRDRLQMLKLCADAVNTLGVKNQVLKAAEEFCEAGAALLRWVVDPQDHRALASELADVEIMLSQMRLVVDAGMIEEEKRYKLRRLGAMLRERGTGNAECGMVKGGKDD